MDFSPGDSTVATRDGDVDARPDPFDAEPRGALIGRYVVLDRIGAGSMGVVYAAYDPQLDRKVAVKLVRPPAGADPERTRTRQQRLVREAKALARLSHPNVVTVYDAGVWQDRVFLAMEFVQGATLSDWVAAQRRGWRETLSVIVDATAGVAAAHAQDLVHRDIKPGNIMVGDDGRVRVMDFGVVTAALDDAEPVSELPSGVEFEVSQELSQGLSAELTMTRDGAAIGTPAYMAPEQHLGEVDARTDQFSLCATAWHVLYGELPFPGDDPTSIAFSVINGDRRPPPADSSVPGWVRRTLERGMSHEASARWPDLDAMTVALEHRSRRAKRRPWALGAALVAVLGIGVWAWGGLEQRRRAKACSTAGEQVVEVWPGVDGAAADEVLAALEATGAPNASATFAVLDRSLHAWAEEWRGSMREACRGELEGRWDAHLRSEAEACLDEARVLAQETVGAYQTLEQPLQSMHTLGVGVEGPGRCLDPLLLRLRPAPPESKRDAVLEVRRTIARAEALHDTGLPIETWQALAEDAVDEAVALQWPPLIARGRRVLAEAHRQHHELDAAERELVLAFRLATSADDPSRAFTIAAELAQLLGPLEGRAGEALVWLEAADAQRARLPPDDRHLDLLRLLAEATAREGLGQLDDAQRCLERAVEVVNTPVGFAADRATAHNNLARILGQRGDVDGALEHLALGRRLLESVVGPGAPEIASNINNRAAILFSTGDRDAAQAGFEEALALREAHFGHHSLPVVDSLSNLAAVNIYLGRFEESLVLLEEALAIGEMLLEYDDPRLVPILTNLGTAVYDHSHEPGALDRANRHLERALEVNEHNFGEDDATNAQILYSLARVRDTQERYGEEQVLLQRAVGICTKVHGPEAPMCAAERFSLGSAAATVEDWATAERELSAAVALLEGQAILPDIRVAASFDLARVLLASGGDLTRARTLAEDALQGARRLRGEPGVPDPDAIGRWLAALP